MTRRCQFCGGTSDGEDIHQCPDKGVAMRAATRGPMHPQEFEERLREAFDEGYRKAMRNEDRRVEDLKDELRNVKALLWGAAYQFQPVPLRINRAARELCGPDAAIRIGEDLATGDLLVFALRGEG